MREFVTDKATCALLAAAIVASGCAARSAAVAAGTVLTMGIGAIPAHYLSQVYYVGVLDPLEQLPPALYRITLRGEASLVSAVRFASGWVKAEVVDSLQGSIRFDSDGNLEISAEGADPVKLSPGRRLWQFGPEGFREAPRDHRLVIVMGGDPSAFFDAINDVLGELSSAQKLEKSSAQRQARRLLELLVEVLREERELDEALREKRP